MIACSASSVISIKRLNQFAAVQFEDIKWSGGITAGQKVLVRLAMKRLAEESAFRNNTLAVLCMRVVVWSGAAQKAGSGDKAPKEEDGTEQRFDAAHGCAHIVLYAMVLAGLCTTLSSSGASQRHW